MILFGFRKKATATASAAPTVASLSVSETGAVRTQNEDHIFSDDARCVYCVADGLGGGQAGALASEIVCRNLKLVLAGADETFESHVAAVRKSIADAHATIQTYAQTKGFDVMGSTVAVLVLDPANLRRGVVCSVGDSRIYRVYRGMPEVLTHDDRHQPGDNTLTRAVGVGEQVKVTCRMCAFSPGSRLLLCTDGVHDVVSTARLGVFVAAGSLETASGRLTEEVRKRGAPDNFSYILVSI